VSEEVDIGQFGQFDHLENIHQRRFLAAFCVTGRVGEAATAADCSRKSHYHWVATSEEYRKAYESCRQTICVAIEDSHVEKLIHGWDEPVYQGGDLVGHKRKFDLAAQMRYLERAKPEVFGAKIEVETNAPEGISVAAHLELMRDSVPQTE